MSGKILLTGSAGFLGRYVREILQAASYDVVCFDKADGQDITNPNHVKQALQDCGSCIHLAAEADLYDAFDNPAQCEQINVQGTAIISALCQQYNVRLLYASTACVYGNNGYAISDETAPAMPTEIYAQTKLQGEKIVQTSCCDYVILRLATFYGIGMRPSLAIHKFVTQNLAGTPIDIHGDGKQTRCYTHVEDVARAMIIALQHKNIPKILNIASSDSHSVNNIITIIEQITGKKSITHFADDRQGQIYHSAIDSSAIKKLGWQTQWSLQQGLENYIKHHMTGENT